MSAPIAEFSGKKSCSPGETEAPEFFKERSSPESVLAHLTPELSRATQRPSRVLHDTAQCEAAKRARLERIVRQGTEVSGAAMFLGISSGDSGALAITFRRLGKNLRRRLEHPKPIPGVYFPSENL